MNLKSGTRLGPYQIIALIGAGGMGEVYRARDTRLDRSVAIKILSAEFAQTARLKIRFQREARAISALNHPNICTLHDLGSDGGIEYLVMEYCEGETLAQRISNRSLSIDLVLEYGIQIADALEKAHRQGIVHRDLKPSNIMITGTGVKLLDFGLARRDTASPPGTNSSFSTVERPVTEEGTILGTVRYMAPELFAGKEADARSDIFALGLILYEMITGRPAFAGDSKPILIASILKDDPKPVLQVEPRTPPPLDGLIRASLIKNPEERIQTAHDVSLQLRWIRDGERRPLRRKSSRLRWIPVGAALVVLAASGAWFRTRFRQAPLHRVVPLTSFEGYEIHPALSPDGKQVAFAWERKEKGVTSQHIYVQLVGRGEPLRLTHSDARDAWPAWSPDGSEIVFLRRSSEGNDVLAIPALGGTERLLTKTASSVGGLDYSPDGRYIAISDQPSPSEPRSIFLLSTQTGEKTRLTTPRPVDGHLTGDAYPAFSPDSKKVSFVRLLDAGGGGGPICIQSLSKNEADVVLHDDGVTYDLGWTPDGKSILFTSGKSGNTFLARVPARRITSDGTERGPNIRESFRLPLGDRTRAFSIVGSRLVLSQRLDDANIWRVSGPLAAEETPPEKFISSTLEEFATDYSPDGKQITFVSDRATFTYETWVSDADGRNVRRLTDMGHTMRPQWSPKGDRILFSSAQRPAPSHSDVYVIDSRGGVPKNLTLDQHNEAIPGWSEDGRSIYFQSDRSGGFWQIWKMSLDTGTMSQITHSEKSKLSPRESGNRVYYHHKGGIWSAAASGGDEKLELENVQAAFWSLWNGNLIFTSGDPQSGANLEMMNLATRERKTLHSLGPGPMLPGEFPGVSPDGRWILFGRYDQSGSDLMLVENFH